MSPGFCFIALTGKSVWGNSTVPGGLCCWYCHGRWCFCSCRTSVYGCSWKSIINSVLPHLSENWCWFHSVTSTKAITNAIIPCWRLSRPTRWYHRLNSTSLRVTYEDCGHSTLPYVEITGNFILSENGAAQAYYLPSYALWNYVCDRLKCSNVDMRSDTLVLIGLTCLSVRVSFIYTLLLINMEY
jgi:hypothetical protein